MYNPIRPASLIPQGQASLGNWGPSCALEGQPPATTTQQQGEGPQRLEKRHCAPLSRAQARAQRLGWYSAAEMRGPSRAARAPALTDLREIEGQGHSCVIPESRQLQH